MTSTGASLPDHESHEPSDHGHSGHGHGGHAHLAHHFDTPVQQFEAAKLGMWLFIATELLLFGGLFCAYAVFRRSHPDVFAYGATFLDTRWGIINTTVLITSSMTMAVAITAAQRSQYRLLVSMLLLTFLGASTFLAVKAIEYHHKFHERLVWGPEFYAAPGWAIEAEQQYLAAARRTAGDLGAVPGEEAAVAHTPDAGHGLTLWNATCRSCHGAAGEGVSGQGKDIRAVEFVTSRSDDELVAFIKAGRVAADPLNTTGVAMPPKGGNPLFKDADLLDIIAHVRTFEPGDGTVAVASDTAEEEFWVPKSSALPPPDGPSGLVPRLLDPVGYSHRPEVPTPHHALDVDRPANAHLFFGLYFVMTGLHGVHVVIGMVVIGWLTFRAIRRDFGPEYFTPLDLGGLYWHVVDLIWIFLFPLLYLI